MMGEHNDFENDMRFRYGNRMPKDLFIPNEQREYFYGKDGRKLGPNFHMRMTQEMKQMVKDLGGVVAIRRLIRQAHKELQDGEE